MKVAEFKHPDRVILVVTALSEERRSVLPFLRKGTVVAKSDSHGREFITGDFYVESESRPWHIALPPPTGAGNAKAAAETALSLALSPAFVFLLGVAGGFPRKVNMYDVVVAERVYDVDVAKIDENGSYISRPDQHKATSVLLSKAKTLQDMGGWQALLSPDLPNVEVEVWIEPIAAGSKLVASSQSEEFKRIQRDAPRAVAVENEGFGVMQAAHEANVAALVIRGISDLIDNRPVEQPAPVNERVGADIDKLKAARHAAAFMFALIGRLSSKEIQEVVDDELDWVNVRLRWRDLQDLTKGRTLALQIIDGSPVRDIVARSGSVEIEFRTTRLVSAFVYAVSLEETLLSEIVDFVPDQVETTIDTTNPDVSRVFSAVRKLGSTDATSRLRGEEEVRILSGEYTELAAIADRAVNASRKAALSSLPPYSDMLQGDRRLSFSITEGLDDYLYELSQSNQITITKVVSRLLTAALTDAVEHEVDLEPFAQRPGMRGHRMQLLLPEQIVQKAQNLAEAQGFSSLQRLIAALIGYGIEMRVSNLFEAGHSQITEHVMLDGDRLKELMRDAEVSVSQLVRSARVDATTMRRAINGRSIHRDAAQRIIATIDKQKETEVNFADYLKGS